VANWPKQETMRLILIYLPRLFLFLALFFFFFFLSPTQKPTHHLRQGMLTSPSHRIICLLATLLATMPVLLSPFTLSLQRQHRHRHLPSHDSQDNSDSSSNSNNFGNHGQESSGTLQNNTHILARVIHRSNNMQHIHTQNFE